MTRPGGKDMLRPRGTALRRREFLPSLRPRKKRDMMGQEEGELISAGLAPGKGERKRESRKRKLLIVGWPLTQRAQKRKCTGGKEEKFYNMRGRCLAIPVRGLKDE